MFICGATFTNTVMSVTPTGNNNNNNLYISDNIYDNLYTTIDVDEDGENVFNSNISSWGDNTLLSAHFNNNLQGGNIEGLLTGLIGIKIKRRVKGTKNWVTLKILLINDLEQVTFTDYDYLNAAKTVYEYGLVPIFAGGIEGPITIREVYSDFDGLYILDKEKIYFGFLNLQFPKPTRQGGINVVNTLNNQYPTIIYNSKLNYYTDTCSATWVAADESQEWGWDFSDGWKYRDQFKNWLLNGKAKLLKYYTGRSWLIVVTGEISDNIDTVEENTVTSFNWTEIGNVNTDEDLLKFGLIERVGD